MCVDKHQLIEAEKKTDTKTVFFFARPLTTCKRMSNLLNVRHCQFIFNGTRQSVRIIQKMATSNETNSIW